MDCPTCKVALVMSDRQGIEIDYCPQCRGIWLDRGELDKIIERSANEAPTNFPAPQQPSFGNQPQQGYYKEHRKKHWLNDLFD
ncbi:Zn-finger nucleic acid-binding protein [Flavobacterium sp. PL11]|jgi:Zn-finger nucleic acid-binding protein|uniref:TFIIB-type zinc ribbon-containing protein n=1 Tax=Flavobacterium sp. PL11 TaxID=3071717 RepID=UPI002DFA36C3|nr:Zn-finger nucleic acid-binding protein [Flavobacterium sp. PL11]